MRLPIDAPVAPMLARLIDEVPDPDAVPGGYVYEPKWDGFRCVILRDGDQVELASRMNKSLTTYFPEVVEHLRQALPQRCVVDAEIIVPTGPIGSQHLDWEALCERVHPSLRRVSRLASQTPAHVVAFDLLALGERDLTQEPLHVRRSMLQDLLQGVSPLLGVHVTTQTRSAEQARTWFNSFEGHGLDGIMVKEREGSYEFGRRSWLKVKHARTAEAVVVGWRRNPRFRGVGKLLLGMYGAGEDESLHYVGTIESLSEVQRIHFAEDLAGLEVPHDEAQVPIGLYAPTGIAGQSTIYLRPERVVEVEFDQLEGRQFRHPAKFHRWRPDREAHTCRLDQLGVGSSYDLASVLD